MNKKKIGNYSEKESQIKNRLELFVKEKRQPLLQIKPLMWGLAGIYAGDYPWPKYK